MIYYRYKLKDCEENNNLDRKSINGIILKKNEWYVSKIKLDKFKNFEHIIDMDDFDPLDEEKNRHNELMKKIEQEKKEQQEKELQQQKQIEEQKRKEEEQSNVSKIERIFTLSKNSDKKDRDRKNNNKKDEDIISNSFGDLIDLSRIKEIENKEIPHDPFSNCRNPERKKYMDLTKKEIIDIILSTDLKNYSRNDFKGRNKEDLLMTLYQVKNI